MDWAKSLLAEANNREGETWIKVQYSDLTKRWHMEVEPGMAGSRLLMNAATGYLVPSPATSTARLLVPGLSLGLMPGGLGHLTLLLPLPGSSGSACT